MALSYEASPRLSPNRSLLFFIVTYKNIKYHNDTWYEINYQYSIHSWFGWSDETE